MYISIHVSIVVYVYIGVHIECYIHIHIHAKLHICMYGHIHIIASSCFLNGQTDNSTIGTIPNMTNIHNILTNIGHRSGHQSGLDESSGRNPTTFLYGVAFRVYFVLAKYIKTQHIDHYVRKLTFFTKTCR